MRDYQKLPATFVQVCVVNMMRNTTFLDRESSVAPGNNGSETVQDVESLGDPFSNASH